MISSELYVGVDEFTLVLQPVCLIEYEAWYSQACDMITKFLNLSGMESLFGKTVSLGKNLPAGYTSGWSFESVPFYFAIGINEQFPKMGVIIKFSAYSWAEYCKAYKDTYSDAMNVSKFLQSIQSEIYTSRISRIDLYADYFNFPDFTVNSIYNQLKNGSYIIQDCKGKTTHRKTAAVEQDFGADTIYIGSKKENTRCLMRIYNKKLEQTSRSGFRLDEALNSTSWVRFEASFRGSYAHSICASLLNIHTEEELSIFIATKITDKFRFVDIDGNYTLFTEELLDLSDSDTYPALKSVNSENNSLYAAVQHIIHGSGLFPAIFKIGEIWGISKEQEFLDILYTIFNNNYRNKAKTDDKINNWLKKNATSLSKQPFKDTILKDTNVTSDKTA